MKLELSTLSDSVFIGDKLNISTKFLFEDDEDILWSGIRLITNPPCKKELQISKEEVFSKGFFEAGEYIRENALLIKGNVVPTIKNRNLGYTVQLVLRKQNPINPDDDLIVKRNQEVGIKVKEKIIQTKANPISFSLSGLKVDLTKDVFKPGETIKINFSSEELKEIEVRLLQKANLVCYCEQYGKNCQNVEELPPAIAGSTKTSNMDKEFLLLKVPDIAEPSHNYIWEPSEKEYWGFKFGDYSEWSLLIIGKKKPEYGREPIKFNLPITIVSTPISEEKIREDFFSGGGSSAPSLFDGLSSKLQKRYKIVSINSSEESGFNVFKIKVKNISNDVLKGVTVKLSGLQEGLFETAPILSGFNTWEKDEEKEISFKTKQNITALISILEDNSQKSIRLQSPIGII